MTLSLPRRAQHFPCKCASSSCCSWLTNSLRRVLDVEGITHPRRISFPPHPTFHPFEFECESLLLLRWIHANSIIPTNRSMDKFAKRLEVRDVAGTSGNSGCGLRSSYDLSEFPLPPRRVVPRVSTPRVMKDRERKGGREGEPDRPAGRLNTLSCNELFISVYL